MRRSLKKRVRGEEEGTTEIPDGYGECVRIGMFKGLGG